MGSAHVISRRWTALVMIGAFAVFGALGCAERITSVDPSFTTVEGVPSPSQLVVFADLPNQGYVYRDTLESGPSNGDYLLEVRDFYTFGPGVVRGMIFDYTPAAAYQVFRRTGNGGFQQIRDFRLTEKKQWVDSQSELYTFFDTTPASWPSVTYVGRGVVADAVTPSSPLTNVADVVLADVDTVHYEGERFPSDSLFTIEWLPVAGAAGYWLQVYQLRADLRTFNERALSGAPAPIYADKATDLLVAYVPAPFTSYQLGTAGPPGTRVLHRRQTFFNFQYVVRVSAVGSSGELLAYTGENSDVAVQLFADETYIVYPIGGVVVSPTADLDPGPNRQGASRAGISARAIEPMLPDLRIVPRAALRLP
ncbi:MAG TPA: hypothetical protein VEY91_08135 [Candidatus Limnocylindria bacterium]|nr:hypothetical protein [Candidatus Limnocylindria bacterium]